MFNFQPVYFSQILKWIKTTRIFLDSDFQEEIVDAMKTRVLVSGLHPATGYSFFVVSETAQGVSKPSRVVQVTTAEAGKIHLRFFASSS